MNVEGTPAPEQEIMPTKHSHRRRSPWGNGVILMLLGVIFLMKNLDIMDIHRWWALFILVPAWFPLTDVWHNYQESRRLTRRDRGPLMGGMSMLIVSFVFLLSWSWHDIWPVFMIILGLSMWLTRDDGDLS